ncbi:MAG TPA: histidine kinase [Rudaea sp.]|nr:histidine kinase [Rudaea sp.]
MTKRPSLANSFLLFAAAFWSLFGVVAGILVWMSMLTHGHSAPLLLGYHLLVWLAWLGPTYVVVWLARRFPVLPPRPSAIAVHALAATAIALLHSLYGLLLMVWMRPYDRRTATLLDLQVGQILLSQLPLEWILYCLVLGAVLAFEFYRRYHERALLAAQLERSLADARLHALELQLQPHFLFNTLNAIAGLVRNGRKEQAVTMIAGLADLLRYSLDHAGRQRVPLAEEIGMLTRYLEIENARFPDRMSFTISVAEDAERAAVPILILQPLAENAVRHGIARTATVGSIEVDARRDGERLQIRMRNSGCLDVASVDGIGLKNTRERLANLYGGAGHFELSQRDGSVLAVLDLPWTAAG